MLLCAKGRKNRQNYRKGHGSFGSFWFLLGVPQVAKFGLTMDPVARGMEEALDLKGEESYALSIVGRTGLGMSALVLATSVPNFALFMALVGSFLTLAVSVIFPSLCYLEIFKDKVSTTMVLHTGRMVAHECSLRVGFTPLHSDPKTTCTFPIYTQAML